MASNGLYSFNTHYYVCSLIQPGSLFYSFLVTDENMGLCLYIQILRIKIETPKYLIFLCVYVRLCMGEKDDEERERES